MLGIRSSNEGTCTANVYDGCIERKRNQPIGGCIEIKKNYQNKGFEGLDCARYEEKNVQFEVLFIKQRFSISFFFQKFSEISKTWLLPADLNTRFNTSPRTVCCERPAICLCYYEFR